MYAYKINHKGRVIFSKFNGEDNILKFYKDRGDYKIVEDDEFPFTIEKDDEGMEYVPGIYDQDGNLLKDKTEKDKRDKDLLKISTIIYSNYPQDKQNRDIFWHNHLINDLTVVVEDLNLLLDSTIKDFEDGKSIQEIFDYLKEEYSEYSEDLLKLIKIKIRSRWLIATVKELKESAGTENFNKIKPFPILK